MSGVDIGRHFNWAAYAPPLNLSVTTTDWNELVAVVKAHVAELLGSHPLNVSLHHNTTAAFQRIVTRMRLHFDGLSPVLLLTDEEYPGLVALLDEQWPGPIVMVRTANYTWRGEVARQLACLDVALRRFKPQVIVLSHVSRASGRVIGDDWLRNIPNVVPEALLILDGAQAVGNIAVTPAALRAATFYVFSGHKWLGGLQTMGVSVCEQSEWYVDDPAQGYSSQAGSRGTGSLNVLSSLAGAFRAHLADDPQKRTTGNAQHGLLLAQKLAKHGVNTLGTHGVSGVASRWVWNGIVSVPLRAYQTLPAETDFAFAHIQPEVFRSAEFGVRAAGPRYVVEFVPGAPTLDNTTTDDASDRLLIEPKNSFCDVPVPLPPHGVARFCVTWRHCERDLDDLINAIISARDQRKPGGTDRG